VRLGREIGFGENFVGSIRGDIVGGGSDRDGDDIAVFWKRQVFGSVAVSQGSVGGSVRNTPVGWFLFFGSTRLPHDHDGAEWRRKPLLLSLTTCC